MRSLTIAILALLSLPAFAQDKVTFAKAQTWELVSAVCESGKAVDVKNSDRKILYTFSEDGGLDVDVVYLGTNDILLNYYYRYLIVNNGSTLVTSLAYHSYDEKLLGKLGFNVQTWLFRPEGDLQSFEYSVNDQELTVKGMAAEVDCETTNSVKTLKFKAGKHPRQTVGELTQTLP